MSTIQKRLQLQAILEGTQCLYCPSVFDPLSARMALEIGFTCGILGGSVASMAVLGAPDVNVLTLTELAEQARRICRGSALPLVADADHGYGNALNVMRAVQELEAAGVAALSIEDSCIPRPYGPAASGLICLEEAVAKVRAAAAARIDHRLVIMARTHAGPSEPAPAVLARVAAFAEAGADAICLTGVQSLDQLKAVAATAALPVVLITYGGQSLGTPDALSACGVRLWVDGHAPYLAAVQATYTALAALRDGTHAPEALGAAPAKLLHRLSGSADYDRWNRQFLGQK